MYRALSSSRGTVLCSRLKHRAPFTDASEPVRLSLCVGRYRQFCTSSSRNNEEGQSVKNINAALKNGSLSRRRCLVTGGASGIGYEVTKHLLLNGASSVTITSRSSQKAQSAIERIKTEINRQDAPLDHVECDFEKTISFDALKKAGDIHDAGSNPYFDTLVNCAGITQTQGLLSTSSSSISLILRTNLEAPIELSRQLLKDYFTYGKQLSKQNSQSDQARPPQSFCVVNISSLLAQRGGYGTSIYSTSKAGLTAFTRTLALEAAAVRSKFPNLPPFRANVVVPGYIDTPMIENFSAQQKEKLEKEIPLQRYGTAAEVADAVMFLLKNEYANNSVLNLDGGLSAT